MWLNMNMFLQEGDDMTETPNRSRWFVAIWLILSQLGGLLLMFVPTVILLTLGAMSLGDGGNPVLSGVACIGPILFITLSGTAWVAFARNLNKPAIIFSTIVLILGGVMRFAIDFYTRYINV